MFAQCRHSIWRSDDFSHCFQHDFLQTLIPLIACALSLVFISVSLLQKALHSKYYHAYTLLNKWNHVWDYRIPPSTSDVPATIDDIDDELDRNTQLALNPTISQVDRTHLVEAKQPPAQLLRIILELGAVTAVLVVNVIALATGDSWGKGGHIAAISGVSVWAYILLLVSARLVLSRPHVISFSTLWNHTGLLYGLQWIISTLLLRSYVLHPRTPLGKPLSIASFVLLSILMLITLSSRIGNKSVELEYEDNIPPPQEPTASIFSLATFGWVDGIVWAGYKKTLDLADVWNIAASDKAAHVLSNYRQVKKTSKLAWHLLAYFKNSLIKQAAWSCVSGVLTFIPTLLLRAILEYVEDPTEAKRSSAWLWVALLFVSGCSSALADGQSLWIGRKLSIRLRAVIIGEIYAKALRRKAAASGDKVLGDDKLSPSSTKGFTNRLLKLIGRGKKDEKPKKDATNKIEEITGEEISAGAIINLMAVDSFKVSEISAYLHFLWAATPVQVIMAVVLLYQILGFSSIAGIGMMILLLPVNLWISQKFASIQMQILAATDARIHTTNEVLSNIRIIKYFAWEQRFLANVDERRSVELERLRVRYILWASAATVWCGAPILITFLSFAVYTLVEKKALIPSIAFTALSLFQILRIPLDQLADMVAHVQESKVSVDRIEEFLSEEDTDKYKQLRHPEIDPAEPVIGFDNATFTWGSRANAAIDLAQSFRMMDLDLHFKVGELNIVAGPTGCGKTSLLMALLGEMTILEGRVYLPGASSRDEIPKSPETGLMESVAYCAQQAWLANANIKDNIVFASPWNENRYKEVLDACSLVNDLEILDNGDETLVGEKGVALSGGQKQRISLARALYCNARHILLDDILSAVDSHTAKWIFDKALQGPLMRNRTCILVTHNISLCLPHAEYAVVLDNGRVTASGSANDVINSGMLGEDLTKSEINHAPRLEKERQSSGSSDSSTTKVDVDLSSNMNGNLNGNLNGKVDGSLSADAEALATSNKHENPTAGPAKATDSPSANAMHEGKAEGGVKIGIIFMYFKAMGPWWYWIIAAFIFTAQQLSTVSTTVWIRQWANAYTSHESQTSSMSHSSWTTKAGGSMSCRNGGACSWNAPFFHIVSPDMSSLDVAPEVDAGYYLGVYIVLGVVYMVITFMREMILFAGSLIASRKIHTRLIKSISRAKFRFFDSTPLGQIMNRFSKDVENLDQEVAPVAVGVLHCLFSIVTIVVLISTILPAFLIAGTGITVLYVLIGRFYISSSRDLKRIESVQRSPLYQQFGETLTGMTTIRAYGDERRFIRENLNKVNTHSRPYLYLWAANRWLAFRVDIVGALVSLFTGVFVMLNIGVVDAGAAGLALTYAVTFTENVLWFVRLYATNEQNMNSVERIKEYMDVEQEAPAFKPEAKPAGNWPSKGAVQFVNYTTRYRSDFDPVLRNISFKTAPCEKIGIVGRTGAGKSSLALALFRALEAEEGRILIDDIDISTIGLQDLRESIVMVPQDPTLFTGTLRSNLDPFGLFTDEEIFAVLRRVQLLGVEATSAAPTRPQTPSGILKSRPQTPGSGVQTPATPTSSENKNVFRKLNTPIAESGSNLSQGQRQLLCLARALLKNPKVLLMDEATASIDYSTDRKVQETIRELKENTIITIAHRLKTIVDYDRVIVMDKGRVVEEGEPWELLKALDEGSTAGKRWFREMCETSGEFDSLLVEAKRSHDGKRLIDDEA